MKTEDRSELMGEVWIADELQSIMDKYPGKGKYIFNFLDDNMNQDQIRAKRESKLVQLMSTLKSFLKFRYPDLSQNMLDIQPCYVKKSLGRLQIG